MSVDQNNSSVADRNESVVTVTIDINTSDSEPSSPVSIELYDGSTESNSESNGGEVFDSSTGMGSDTGVYDAGSLHYVGSSESGDTTSDDDSCDSSTDYDGNNCGNRVGVLGDRESDSEGEHDGNSDDDWGSDDGLSAGRYKPGRVRGRRGGLDGRDEDDLANRDQRRRNTDDDDDVLAN